MCFRAGAGSPCLVWCVVCLRRALTGAGSPARAPRLGDSLLSCCGTPAAGARVASSLQNAALQGDARAGRRDRRGRMGLYACVAPMHPCLALARAPACLLVSLQAASPFCARYNLHGICSSLRAAGDSELSASTRNYRWLAVSLGSDADFEQH